MMPTPDVSISRNDTTPLSDTLRNAEGDAINILEATVSFHMRPIGSATPKISAPASNNQVGDGETDGTKGAVSYQFVEGDTDTAGWYLAQWEVTFLLGRVQTFPTDGWILIAINEDIA